MKRLNLIPLVLLVLLTGVARAGVPHQPQSDSFSLVYLKSGALWRQRVSEGQGHSARLVGPAARICSLPVDPTARWLQLVVSQNGERAAVAPGDSDGNGVFLVDVQPAAKPRFFAALTNPTFSPDGSQLAVCNSADRLTNPTPIANIVVLDLRRNKWRLLYRGADEPVWSRDGMEIVATEDIDAHGCKGGAIVIDAQSGALRFQTPRAVSPALPFISPARRYVAILHDISRPKMGHEIFDRRTGKAITDDRNFASEKSTCSWRCSRTGRRTAGTCSGTGAGKTRITTGVGSTTRSASRHSSQV